MKIATTLLVSFVLVVLTCSTAVAQVQKTSPTNPLLQQLYGPNYEEILDKYGDDPVKLLEAEQAYMAQRFQTPYFDYLKSRLAGHSPHVGRSEVEPNNFFDTADNINDVLALPGRLAEYNGKLIEATLTEGDVDVYRFTVDTLKMYYFASLHSFLDNGNDGLGINMRLFHETDLDTTFTVDAAGIAGNDKMSGDILGRDSDGRGNSGDFRLTGWVSPVDPATGAKLTGDFYLYVFNDASQTGTYLMTAYCIDLEPWVSKGEQNQTFLDALTNGIALPSDAVVRTYMIFNPDTVKIVIPDVPVQSNAVFPLLLAQGDEDVDHFRIDYKADHTLVIETLPYFGWYRENDGGVGPGSSRLSDPRIRLYDADYTQILEEDDDDARERMDGPNNIHSRLVLTPNTLADNGITADTPLWLWVSAWASQTRDPTQSVDNRDPGRHMYDVYVTQYHINPVEFEPNDTAPDATSITARADTVINGSLGAGDVDMYRVFLHEVRMYSIFTQNSTVSDDIQVEIFREFESDNMGGTALTANVLTEAVAGNAGNNDFLISGFVPEESGAYLIRLTAASAGDYQLGVVDKGEIYGARITNEPDNEIADATDQDALEVGPGAASRTALIFPSGDVDNHQFTVGAGFDLTLSIGGSQDIVDDFAVEMTLIDPSGNEVATSTSGISHTTTEGGQYIVAVRATNGTDVGFYTLSGGEPFIETEGNGSFETANLIALGNIYEASLGAGDVDFFKFTLNAGSLYSFRSLDNETGGALSVEFFDEIDGTTLLDESGWPSNYDGDNFKIANIIPRETKTYYLKISGGAGAYKITSRINADYYGLNHKGEPNNSASEADAQGDYQRFGADESYVLSNTAHPRFFGDEDWFRVTLSAGQTLVAETKPVGGDDWNKDTDTRIVILDANGTAELVNDDDGGNEWYSRALYQATADGPVYVQVRTSATTEGANDRGLNRGDYILNIDVTSGEVEPNNSFAEADGNTLSQGFIDAEYTEGDLVDIYRLSLEADHIYHVRTIRPPDGGYGGTFSAQLFKASDTGTNLLDATGYNDRYTNSRELFGDDNLKLNIIPDETGVYYLQIDGDNTGPYKVGLKGRDISTLKAKGEPNNTIAEADAIGTQAFDKPGEAELYMLYNENFVFVPGDPITAEWGDDLDLYKYELSAGDTLLAETSPADGFLWSRDFDGFMELLNAEGNPVTENNDDGGLDWHSRIEYIAPADTVVYVLVRSQDFGRGPNGGSDDRDPSRGEYNLLVTKMDGTAINIPVNVESDETPLTFALNQNYPNPFNPATTISYILPEQSEVSLIIYNLLGQQVAMLVHQRQPTGAYNVRFDASRLASGMYFYQLRAGNFVETKTMLLIK